MKHYISRFVSEDGALLSLSEGIVPQLFFYNILIAKWNGLVSSCDIFFILFAISIEMHFYKVEKHEIGKKLSCRFHNFLIEGWRLHEFVSISCPLLKISRTFWLGKYIYIYIVGNHPGLELCWTWLSFSQNCFHYLPHSDLLTFHQFSALPLHSNLSQSRSLRLLRTILITSLWSVTTSPHSCIVLFFLKRENRVPEVRILRRYETYSFTD